ncbi:wnt inhibitory factor 1-like isoform X2 [Ruditapes philippinarum]|uniref:wnt inhibitory factor 1-like isoform X2 n=1 Tax=Ruditapes philippinarum TaxID=129788 RepID=UPI00295B315A|nr:wnt inhibitory factor 1-like isoform X2 [Ruditapes philippinarum]
MVGRIFAINLSIVVFCMIVAVTESQNWRGNTESFGTWKAKRCRRCVIQYRTYCGAWRSFVCKTRVTQLRCLTGWTHNGDYNCSIPICKPNCGSVGECVAPGKCDCKGLAGGQYCQYSLTESQNWTGHCALWRNFKCYMPVTKLRCSTGWTHNGDYNCSIPICKPNCGSVGECVAPGKCDCKGLTEGQYCQELLNSSPRNASENNGQ